MDAKAHRWAIVLAAGDGTRLRAFTGHTTERPVPKQFCALRGTRSMLQEALRRAESIVPRDRIVVIVAAQHRQWWEAELNELPPANLLVQPRNRGTGVGILLPLFLVHGRDPEAVVVVMPSDHFVDRSDVLCSSIEEALLEAGRPGDRLVLLGVTPEEADPDYGWILPAEDRRSSSVKRVATFVEKPAASVARDLMLRGALINAFVVAGRSRSLLDLYRQRDSLLERFQSVVGDRSTGAARGGLRRLYAGLQACDFCRDLLQSASEQELYVLRVPSCGWSDLGTPDRVIACLQRDEKRSSSQGWCPPAALSLAAVAEAWSVAGRCP